MSVDVLLQSDPTSHCDCKQRTIVPTWKWNCRVNIKSAKPILVEGWIKACSGGANKSNDDERQFTIYSLVSFDKTFNAERQAIVNEFERPQNVRGRCVPERSCGMGFKELQLTTMQSQLTMSRLCKTRSHVLQMHISSNFNFHSFLSMYFSLNLHSSKKSSS